MDKSGFTGTSFLSKQVAKTARLPAPVLSDWKPEKLGNIDFSWSYFPL